MNYGRTIARCFRGAMFCAAVGFLLAILPVRLAPVLAVLALSAGGLLVVRATYYLGRYEEQQSGGGQEWSIFEDETTGDHH